MTERKPKECEESCENRLQNDAHCTVEEPICRAEIESMIGDVDRDLVLRGVARSVEGPGREGLGTGSMTLSMSSFLGKLGTTALRRQKRCRWRTGRASAAVVQKERMESSKWNHMVQGIFPDTAKRWIERKKKEFSCWPPVGWVRFVSLWRFKPISRIFGFDRGLPIDRYYIERFLSAHAEDVWGRVLEIAEDTYTRRFGGERVTRSDVLHVIEGNPKATIVTDLTCADEIPSDTFECIIFTQTLQHIYDVRASIRHLYRILKPGGVLFATCCGISQISRYDMDRWGDYWRFTTLSARRLFEEAFPATSVTVKAYGNVLAAIAFLHGLVTEDLRQEELDYSDPDYEMLITVRAVKPLGGGR